MRILIGDNLHHIPDDDVLSLAFPPNLAVLIAIGRDDDFASINHDPVPVQRVLR